MTVPAPQLAPNRRLQLLLTARAERDVWIAATLVCAAYVAVIAPLTSFPMQDYPNHVARAAIMADILFHHGAQFGRFFEVHLAAVPYVLPDLILAGAVDVFGPSIGAGVCTSLAVLSLPSALLFYGYVMRLPWNARLFTLMVGLYLSTDWFFQIGFFAYRLGVALFVAGLSMAELLRVRWSAPRFAAYAAVLAAGYLTHLTAPVFMLVAVSVTGLVRLRFNTTTMRREICLAAPIAVLLAFYLDGKARRPESIIHSWLANLQEPGLGHLLSTKIRHLPAEFTGFDWHIALPTLLAFSAILFLWVRRYLTRSNLARAAVIEQLVLAAAFLGVYFILPSAYVDASYVDLRALPIVTLALLFACLRLAEAAPIGELAVILRLAILFAAANLVYFAHPLIANEAWIERYRTVVASVPKGSYVLPIKTETAHQHLLHIDAFVALDRGAIIPYLFSADAGDPVSYFRYRDRPYTPYYQWYRDSLLHLARGGGADAVNVDWARVRCEYDYLLLTAPFDPQLLHVPTTRVAENEAAALLAIDKRAAFCL
jgi:hypothetical protein